MIRVGLTGGIATGKSTVSRMLQELGAPLIDADLVAREIVTPGQPALAEIAAAFGAEVLGPDGALRRKALGAIVFSDPGALERLNQITHPRIFGTIRARLDALEASGASAAVVDAAILIETGNYRSYAPLWVVSCPPRIQLARLMARDGFDEAAARSRLRAQMPLSEKEALADRVIWNSGGLDALRREVEAAWSSLER